MLGILIFLDILVDIAMLLPDVCVCCTSVGVSVLPPHPTPAPMSPRSPVKERNERDFQIVSQHGWQREKRKKKRRQQGQVQSRGNWKVEGTSQWQYPAELVITDLQELMFLDEFIGKKVGTVYPIIFICTFSFFASHRFKYRWIFVLFQLLFTLSKKDWCTFYQFECCV